MSFGDNNKSPISNVISGAVRNFDQVLAPAFGAGIGGSSSSASPAPKSLMSAPVATPADTPGRHKTLLGQ